MPTKQATSPPRLEAPTVPPSNGHAAAAASEWPGLDVDLDRFRRDLGPMCEKVAAWAVERADKVRAVYVSAKPAQVDFYIVTRTPPFDFDLSRDETALLVKLGRLFPVGPIEMTQVSLDWAASVNTPNPLRLIHDNG